MQDVCWPNTWRIEGVHKAYIRRNQGAYKAYTRCAHGRHKAQSLQLQAVCTSATGTRARVARVRAEYPSQLDYSGCWLQAARRGCLQADLGDLGRLTAAGCSSPWSLLGPGNPQGTYAALPPQD